MLISFKNTLTDIPRIWFDTNIFSTLGSVKWRYKLTIIVAIFKELTVYWGKINK